MKKRIWKKAVAISLTMAMSMSLAACGNSSDSNKKGEENEDIGVTIDSIKLGEDYTDIEADLKFLTHKTDAVDDKFQEYISEFQKMYPNINIEYEGITNYADDIITRLTTGNWGDICMIPANVDKDELGNYFAKLGNKSELAGIYDEKFLEQYSFEGISYGAPSMVNVQGIIYNTKVFEQAGIDELPTTPDEFLDALDSIRSRTDATPLYTNFAAGWTMTAWDAYIDGGATGDPDYVNTGLTKGEDPFSDRGDGTGPYAVYNTLYEAVKRGYTEDDPTVTDWEGCKGMINRGEIGCMALGSWAIVQMQEAGDNGADISYMPFPITVSGNQYIAAGGDYNYGINCNSSKDNQIAAMCYIKWLVEKSGFAQSEGGLSVVIGDEVPAALEPISEVEFVVNNPAPDEEATLFNDVNNESELGINSSGAIAKEIVEQATIPSGKTMEELVQEWNEKWTAAQEKYGITH